MKIKIGKRKHSLDTILSRYVRGAVYAKIAGLFFLAAPKKKKNRITIMGHTYSGNAKAFAEWLQDKHPEIEIIFATDDPTYYKIMKNQDQPNIKMYLLQNLRHLQRIAQSKVICTTHGPVFLKYWAGKKKAPLFAELWHGAGFKNRTVKDNKPMLFYDAVFVSSPTYAQFHKNWGYRDEQLHITGYAQVDSLVRLPSTKELDKIRQDFSVDRRKKVVLYAPTWNSKNTSQPSLFSVPPEELLTDLALLAKDNNAQLLVLPHLNSSFKLPTNIPNLTIISGSGEFDIKPLLHIVDVLITDWSSIYTDFIALPEQKPVIFLDTKPTFYGFTLTPEDRAGKLVSSVEDLKVTVEKALTKPDMYLEEYSSRIKSVTQKVWGDTLDGKSSERYFSAIKGLLDERER